MSPPRSATSTMAITARATLPTIARAGNRAAYLALTRSKESAVRKILLVVIGTLSIALMVAGCALPPASQTPICCCAGPRCEFEPLGVGPPDGSGLARPVSLLEG
jgi:hypothetical protein